MNSPTKLPIAHGDGCYFVSEREAKDLFENKQVLCTYGKNPNGSVMNIAGVVNEKGNVAALMPHPERAMEPFQGGEGGRSFFEVFR